MNRLVSALALTVAALLIVAATVLFATAAGAADGYDPSNCPDCINKNKGPGQGSGFRFDHECAVDGSGNGRYLITFYNKDATRDAEAIVNGQRAVVPPGGQHTFTVPFSTRVATLTWQATYSDGKVAIPLRSKQFDCPCTTTSTSSPPSSPPPTPATTVPGSTTPPASSTPGTTTPHTTSVTVTRTKTPDTLPATGSGLAADWHVAALAGLAILGGFALVVFTAKER